MFSVFRAIEEFGLRRQERRLEKRAEKKRREALPHVFGASLSVLEELFSPSSDSLRTEDRPGAYPRVEYLGNIGFNAVLLTQNIEINQFPLYLKVIEESRKEVTFHHYQKDDLHTFVFHDDEFGGRNMRLLTNDVELVKNLTRLGFHPPPPWIVLYELGPYRPASQGNPEYWACYVWDPFWQSLSLEEQDKLIEEWRPRTRAYISDEDWEEGWVYGMRIRDPRFRAREEGEGHNDSA